MSRNRYIEILAPAGSAQQLEAAVRSGADAVYLGMGSMNARCSAANFEGESFDEAVAMCHERGVRVYLVLNTLVFDDELAQADELVRRACETGVDGIIVQDVGLAARIRRMAPEMPLHASTQLSVHSEAALRTLEEMGFCRAVVARELSREELCEMAKRSPIELEVFVHGALCMSVSGQCYMSAVLGTRSGNRGRCAQPCRLPFKAGERQYCLSLRDNSLLGAIDELREMGIASLKIEGRMKRPEYCAAAVTACRQARDEGGVEPQLGEQLEAVFSRSGFTDGYFTARRGERMFGHRTVEDVEAAAPVMARLHELYKNEFRRVETEIVFTAKAEQAVSLSVTDGEHSVTVSGEVPQRAQGRPMTAEDIAARLSKTGGTPYLAKEVRCDIDEGLFMPIAAINALRREALERLSELRRKPKKKPVQELSRPVQARGRTSGARELHAVVRSTEQIPKELPKAVRRVYVPLETPREQLEQTVARLSAQGVETAVEAQRGLFGAQERITEMMKSAYAAGVRVCMIHNIGLIEPAKESGLQAYGGFGLNITNTDALAQYRELGLCGAELSFELTLERIARLGDELPRAVCIYGYLPLMLTRNCPSALSGRCPGRPDEQCGIIDRMGKRMAVRCRGEGASRCAEVFNTVPMSIADKQAQITGAEHMLARFTVESAQEISELMRRCAEGSEVREQNEERASVTRGLYYRGVL